MKITCKLAARLILSAMDLDLDGATRLALDAHLRVCSDCRTFQSQHLLIRRAARALRGQAPYLRLFRDGDRRLH